MINIEILKTLQEMGEDETLCGYCHQTNYGANKSVHSPSGVDFCEGRWCESSYESYLDEFEVTENLVKYQNNVKFINKEDFK